MGDKDVDAQFADIVAHWQGPRDDNRMVMAVFKTAMAFSDPGGAFFAMSSISAVTLRVVSAIWASAVRLNSAWAAVAMEARLRL